MNVNPIYGVLVVAAGLFASSVSIFFEWFFVLRTEEYKSATKDIEELKKKLEKMTKKIGITSSSSVLQKKLGKTDKQKETLEKEIEQKEQLLGVTRMRSTIVSFIFMICMFALLNTLFDGRIVAKLPFEPFGIVTGLSHRNLPGEDYTDCSFLFLYVLSTVTFRTFVQQVFSIEQQQKSNFFGLKMPQ